MNSNMGNSFDPINHLISLPDSRDCENLKEEIINAFLEGPLFTTPLSVERSGSNTKILIRRLTNPMNSFDKEILLLKKSLEEYALDKVSIFEFITPAKIFSVHYSMLDFSLLGIIKNSQSGYFKKVDWENPEEGLAGLSLSGNLFIKGKIIASFE